MDTLNQRRSLTHMMVTTGASGDTDTEFSPRFRSRTGTTTKLSTQLDIRMDTTHAVDRDDDSEATRRADGAPRGTDDGKYRPSGGDEVFDIQK